jgi:hypothetical protein
MTDDRQDAERYRAIKARHAYSLVSRFIDKGSYSSHRAGAQIDAWADAAAQEVAEWEAKTPDEKTAWFAEYTERAAAALADREAK